VVDPAGNSAEAVHHGPPRADGTTLDHLWLRVGDLEASTRFYETVAPVVGHRVVRLPNRTRIAGDGASFSVVKGQPTEHVHLAFGAPDHATVERFHRAGVEAGYASLGEPGERAVYHPGYYGAYLRDPDGHNVEAVYHARR
jgi:catechol 2,3-dioxygenase-like lactoylglutathione lyase family enzyme